MTQSFRVIAVFISVASFTVSTSQTEESHVKARETVLERKVHIEENLILDIPRVPRLCDEMDIWKRHLHIGDCSLYCEQEGQGMPIVLLHGGPGGTHHCFHPHFSRAKEFAKIIYYDQRGCGVSQYRDGDGYSVDQATDDLEGLRDVLGFSKWIVLGYSYGGTLAQNYAVKYPERVAGLVLVGSACYGQPVDTTRTRQYDFISSEERERIREIHSTAGLTTEQSLFNAHLNGDWKRQSFYRPSRHELALGALYEWQHDEDFRKAMSRSLNKLDFNGYFDECPIPVLIMEGKSDLTWDQDKPKALQACFPESQLAIFEHAGHSPFEDEPERFFAVLREFVQKLQDVSEMEIASWKERIVKLNREKKKPVPTGKATHEVVFRTGEVAPTGFTSWTFHCEVPKIEPDAILQYVVLQPDGKEYYRKTLSGLVKKGESIRCDFFEGFAGGEPKVFYNQHITFKFTVDRGLIEFPDEPQFRFEFHTLVNAVELLEKDIKKETQN